MSAPTRLSIADLDALVQEHLDRMNAYYKAHADDNDSPDYTTDCLTCEGTGEVIVSLPGEHGSGELLVGEVCPECNGDGRKDGNA